jgi:FixJ family two-component response regulator
LSRHAEGRVNRDQLKNWRNNFGTLTARELEVFKRVVEGKPNKQIAGELGAAERTVKAHRAHVMHKMHVVSLAELVHIAYLLQVAGAASANQPRV